MNRLPWRLFGLLIAVPAVVLAWFGFRAVRVDRIEAEQEWRDRQAQIARLANAAILTALSPIETELPRSGDGMRYPTLPAGIDSVTFHRSGIVTFPRHRVYFGPFGRHPLERERLTTWAANATPLIEQAQTAEARGHVEDALALLARVRSAEPRLRDWTEIARARIRFRHGDAAALETLARADWSTSGGVTPSGLPAALVACAAGEDVSNGERRAFVPLFEATLAALRGGRWWLSADERRFYDAQLRELLHRATGASLSPDRRIGELAEIERVIRQSPPSRRAGPTRALERSDASTFLLVWAPSSSDPDAWNGIVVPQSRAGAFIGSPLQGLFAGESAAVRDTSGGLVWGSRRASESPWHTEPLKSIPGWEIAFSGPGDAGGFTRRQWLWFALVLLMLLVLLVGLGMTTYTVRREMELARMQSDFVAAVTHEFKSPITGIRLLLERINSGRIMSAQSAAKYCGAIGQETDRLDRLVNRLLEAQQIDAGRRQYECASESLEEIAADVIRHMQGHADAKSITIELQVDPPISPVVVDRASITDAIENLVDNAIKYSPPQKRIVIHVYAAADHVCVDVEDEGIGIDHDELPRVFDKFYRGRRGDRQNVRGTGLGLALVKAAVEAHGGTVDLSSEPGVGSRFSLRLPA